MKILFKFCFTCIFGLMVWRRGATTRLLEWREREKKKLHWTSDHQILISIGRNEKSAVGWKGHWRDPIWISRESPWIRLYSVHLQVSNQQVTIRIDAAPEWDELTNRSKNVKKCATPESQQRAVPSSALRCQSTERQTLKNLLLRCVTTGSFRSIDQICKIQKKKNELQPLMNIAAVDVTLMDLTQKQLTSRPSFAFHRRDRALPYVLSGRSCFCQLIHPFLFVDELCGWISC